jgi:hypothetical protein
MTRRKRLYLVLGTLILVSVVVYGALWLTRPKYRINEESVRAIRVGMTEEEVVAIIGVPPGSYASDGVLPNNASPLDGDEPTPGSQYKTWFSERMGILVRFGASGRVEGRWSISVFSVWEETLFERIRRRLGF